MLSVLIDRQKFERDVSERDRKEAEKVLKEISINKIWIDSYNDVNSAIEDFKILYDFHISGDVSEDELEFEYNWLKYFLKISRLNEYFPTESILYFYNS